MTEEQHLHMLQRPTGRVDVILDTDAYNEVDDQFAIGYMLRSPERLRTVAIYAAPFHNQNSSSPEDGMEKSHGEILRVAALAGWDHPENVYKGSRTYLPDVHTPVDSPAARDLAQRAMAYTWQKPLYVVCIGAITNVASALLMNPAIRERMVVIWLGGNGFHWHGRQDFNMRQDIPAAQVVLGCGVPVVLLPVYGVTQVFLTTGDELRAHLLGTTPLADDLARRAIAAGEKDSPGKPWCRNLWDPVAIGWLMDTEGKWILDEIIPSPIPDAEGRWTFDEARHRIRCAYGMYRDPMMQDMFRRLTR